MENEVVLPPAETAQADTPKVDELTAKNREIDSQEGENIETKEEPKPPKTPEQRELDKKQKAIDRRTRQLRETQARADSLEQELTQYKKGVNYQAQDGDSETLSVTKAQLRELARAEASRLAPSIVKQEQEVTKVRTVLNSLESEFGKSKFEDILDEVNEVTGGLIDANKQRTPIADAIFGADNPKKVMEWFADPDNEDAASRLSGLSAFQLGKEFAKLEAKLSENPKPQVSKAPAPIEAARANAGKISNLPQDTDSTEEWMRKENARMKAAGIRRYG